MYVCIYIYKYVYYKYIMCVLYVWYIYIYIISFYLIKSSYTERKQVIWFLIFLRYSLTVLLTNTKWSSVTATHFFVSNTRTNSVTHTLQKCGCYIRDLFAWVFESFILPFLITKLNFWTWYCVLWIVVGSKKLSGNMWLYSWVR